MINLKKISKLKTDEGKLSFTVMNQKYEAERDYALIPGEQIAKMLNKEVYHDADNGTLYVV